MDELRPAHRTLRPRRVPYKHHVQNGFCAAVLVQLHESSAYCSCNWMEFKNDPLQNDRNITPSNTADSSQERSRSEGPESERASERATKQQRRSTTHHTNKSPLAAFGRPTCSHSPAPLVLLTSFLACTPIICAAPVCPNPHRGGLPPCATLPAPASRAPCSS